MKRECIHEDAGRRGSALIITLFLGIFFASIGYYTYVTSVGAKRESSLRENQAKAQATAEFASELAMANLSDMDFQFDAEGKRTSILRDWVSRQLFEPAADQRRITGSLDGYDYRVRVRSAREAYDEARPFRPTMPAGWLTKPDDYAFGTARPDYFTNIYELTAVARNANAGNDPAKAGEAVVRTVVDYRYQSPLSDQDRLAVLHLDDPAGLLAAKASISGEDHYGIKVNREEVETKITQETVIQPKRMTATDAKFQSAIAQYWIEGRSTLNFRVGDVPNPYVPATRKFGTGLNQQMVAYDPTRRADYYFLGGKVDGKSVTLTPGYDAIPEGVSVAETGKEGFHKIVEVSSVMASSGSKFDIAVGSYEDLGRIYLTATGEGADNPVDQKREWHENAVGQISLRELPYKLYSESDTPFFNSSIPQARRPLTRHYIMNAKGQILVREYPNSAYNDFYYPSRFVPNVRDAWTGYYVWTDKATVEGIAYYVFPENTVLDGVLVKKNSRRSIIPRSFEWEEIQGYELIRDEKGVPASVLRDTRGVPVPWPVDFWGDRKNVLPLKAVMPELPSGFAYDSAQISLYGFTPVKIEHEGKPFYAVPGQWVDWKEGEMTPPLRAGPPNFKSTTEPYGISSPVTAETSPERRKEILAGRIKVEGFNEKNQYGKQVRPEAPGVDFFDGKIRVKETSDDGAIVVKEYSSMADFEYKRNIGGSGGAEDIRSMTTFFICTEDLPEDRGPDFDYGDMSYVLNIIPPVEEIVDGKDHLDSATSNKTSHWWIPPANNSLTGGTSHTAVSVNIPDEIRRIADPVERLKKTYELLGIYDPANPDATFDKINTMLGLDGKVGGFPRAIFIIGGPNNGALANPVKPGDSNIRYYTNDDLDFFFSFYDPMAVIPGDTRLYSELSNEEPRMERRALGLAKMREMHPGIDFQIIDERFNEGRTEAGLLDGALGIPNRAMTSRQYASSIFGHQNKLMPIMGVDVNGRVITPAAKSQLSLGFLPGEWRQKDGAEALDSATSPDYVPLSSSITVDQKQPNGDPVKPRIIFKNDEGYAAEIRSTPEEVDIDAIQAKYGLNDRREGLGWHRGGPKASEPLLLDFFEYIIMADKGYIPYSTVAASGKEYLAGSRKPVDRDGNILSVDVNGMYYYIDADSKKIITTPDPDASTGPFQTSLKSVGEMPTFVFSGETLDGAGVLVVNGNLDIRTLFAYSGILIVLGDLTTTPTEYKDAIKYGEDGNPVDAAGNSLRRNRAGNYYYMKDGKQVISEPVRETVVRGDLVLQGKALVSGKVQENEVMIDGVKHKGNIDIRYSKQAIEDVLIPFTTGNEKFVAERLGWSSDLSLFGAGGNTGNVENLWNNIED